MEKNIIFNNCHIGDEVFFIDLEDMNLRKGEVKDIIHSKNITYYEIVPDIGDHEQYMQVVFKTLDDCSRFCVCAIETLLNIQEDVKVLNNTKFKIEDTVYYYDYEENKVEKDKVKSIGDFHELGGQVYYLKNNFSSFLEKELFKTFEECKANYISSFKDMLSDSRIMPLPEDTVKSYKERLEKIKEQVEER